MTKEIKQNEGVEVTKKMPKRVNRVSTKNEVNQNKINATNLRKKNDVRDNTKNRESKNSNFIESKMAKREANKENVNLKLEEKRVK